MSVQLSDKQREIFICIMEGSPVVPEAQFLELMFHKSGKQTLVAMANLIVDKRLWLVFTLGTLSNHVYINITEGDPAAIADALAELEEYDSGGSVLCYESSYRSPNKYLLERGLVASAMFNPATFTPLEFLDNPFSAGGETISTLLVVFLTEVEYMEKLEHGFDALIELLEREGKNVIS